MAERRTSYLSPKKVLREKEYEEYKELQRRLKKRQLRKDIEELRKRAKEERREAKYQSSRTGKLGKGIKKVLTYRRGGITRALYGRQRPTTSRGLSTGGRGRPRGSVKYRHPVTGQPIGVYEYRKLSALQRWKEKERVRQQSAFSPENLEVMRRLQEQRRIARMSPERRIIPDTYGEIPLSGIMDEINRASNLVE